VLASKLSSGLESLYTGYAPFWPAAGLGSASLAIYGLRYAPAILLASLIVGLTNGFSPPPAAWFALVDTAEASLVAFLLHRWHVGFALARARDVGRLTAAGLAGATLNAGLNGPVLHVMNAVPGTLWSILSGWILGNGIGHLVAGGALLVWSAPAAERWEERRIERLLLAAATIAVSLWVFLSAPPHTASRLLYLILALVTWTAARVGQRAVTLTMLGLSALAAWAVVPGTGPFAADAGRALQLFLGVCAFCAYGIAAVAAEREETAKLREQEARYRVMADASPNLIWLTAADGHVDFFNARATEYTGIQTPAGGAWWVELIHPDDVAPTLQAWNAAVAEGRPCRIEQRLRRADGEYRWHWVVVAPMHGSPGREVRWIGTATDIHDRKLAELETASWRSHFERAQAVGQLGSWEAELKVPDGRLVWSSELFRIFGVSPEEFGGRNADFFSLVHPDDRERVRVTAQQAVDSGTRYSIEHRIVRPDGEVRWVHEAADVTTGRDGQPRMVGVCRDITERVRAEEERRALEQNLLQAQKLESLGILAGGIAHDFNNLLVGILGNASLALLDVPEEGSARQAVRRIETSALRAADLVKQMLAYSGKSALRLEPVDLSALVGEMGELLGTVISKKARLQYELAEGLPYVQGDPTQLRQVVMNLITNASDALGDDPGHITVRTSRLEVRQPANHPLLAGVDAKAGPYVELQVIDTGSGMDRETQGRIFDPFFTTKFTGRGLGLAATLGIVRGHQGAIGVRSQPGRGTTFTVYLPLTLAVTQTVMVRAGSVNAAILASAVEQVLRVKADELVGLYEKGVVSFQGHDYPLSYLRELLGHRGATDIQPSNSLLLVRGGNQRAAIHVDQLFGNREMVVKNIGPQLSRLPGVSGATVMPDGSIVLILNPVQLAARRQQTVTRAAGVEATSSMTAAAPVVMVVDDSITVRKVTTRLLEREGYRVLTARDGVDALEQLKNVERPAVMLIDIEMPRMDGFDLTRNVRGDPKTMDIPIIVISSRSAPKHRSRAAELGVNVYLGKPYEEADLLQQIASFVRR